MFSNRIFRSKVKEKNFFLLTASYEMLRIRTSASFVRWQTLGKLYIKVIPSKRVPCKYVDDTLFKSSSYFCQDALRTELGHFWVGRKHFQSVLTVMINSSVYDDNLEFVTQNVPFAKINTKTILEHYFNKSWLWFWFLPSDLPHVFNTSRRCLA